MKIRLPERVAGVREAMFVVEAEFPVSSSERKIEVKTTGPIQAMDVRGTAQGGSYILPVGAERLHIPVRVTHGGEGDATIEVGCTSGPEAGQSEARTILLDPRMVAGATQVADAKPGRGGKLLAATLLVGALAGGGYMAKDKIASFFRGAATVPEVLGWNQTTAERKLQDEGYVARFVNESVEDESEAGLVVDTMPPTGTELAPGSTITLKVGVPESVGFPVPVLSGMTETEAQATLDELNLQANVQYRQVDDPKLVGRVLSQVPTRGAVLKRGANVQLDVGGESRSIADVMAPKPIEGEGAVTDPSASSPITTTPIAGQPNGSGQPGATDLPDPVAQPEATGPTIAEGGTDTTEMEPAGTAPRPTIADNGTSTSSTDAPVDEGEPASTNPSETDPVETQPVDPQSTAQQPTAKGPDASNAVDGAAETDVPFEDLPYDDGLVAIPIVIGKSEAEARAMIDKLGLFLSIEKQVVSNKSSVGKVVRSIPAATERVSPAGMIQLWVGISDEPSAPTATTDQSSDESTPVANEPNGRRPIEPSPSDPQPKNPDSALGTKPNEGNDTVENGTTNEVAGPSDTGETNPQDEMGTSSTESSTDSFPKEADTEPQPTPPPAIERTAVPDVVALSRERAEALVRRAKLYYDIRYEETEDLPDGQVISQDPAAGSTLDLGKVVQLTVARLPRSYSGRLPEVLGMERNEAEARLRRRKVQVRVTYGGGESSQTGSVLDMSPTAGEEVAEGDWVELVIATGKGGEVPKAVGGPAPSSVTSAPKIARAERRPPGVGRGVSLAPPPTARGNAPAKRVRLPSRDSEPTATVPNVAGQSVYAAIERVLLAGLLPIVKAGTTGEGAVGNVLSQSTEADKMVHLGDLFRFSVYQPKVPGQRIVDIPNTVGGSAFRAHRRLQQAGVTVRFMEVEIPDHPYAGTRRVAAQYPVSGVSATVTPEVTLWIIK